MPAHAPKDAQSGHPGHLNPGQQHTLDKFRSELVAEGYLDTDKFDDKMLLRFLRARKFDLAKAKIMWIDFIKWREDFKVDELYETFEYPEHVEVDKLYPKFYHKTDKDGRPVYIEILGKIDVAKLDQVTTQERQLQRLVVEYERFLRDRLPICSEVSGHLVETSCTIMDLKGVGVSQFWAVKNFVQSAAGVSQNNYPETMGKFYIVNSPWGFSTVWKFVKPWLDEVTAAKIDILGSDYVKTLSAQIPPENLPKFLGGTCSCPEGCTLSNAGPWTDPALIKRVKEKQQAEKAKNGKEEAAAPAAVPATNTAHTDAAPAGDAAALAAPGAIQHKAEETPLPAPVADTTANNAGAPVPASQTFSSEQQQPKMTLVESKIDS